MNGLNTDKANPQADDIWGEGSTASSPTDIWADSFDGDSPQGSTGEDLFSGGSADDPFADFNTGVGMESTEDSFTEFNAQSSPKNDDPFADFNQASSDADKDYWANQAAYMPNQTDNTENPIQEGSIGKVKLGYKSVGLLVSLFFIILAAVFMVLGSIKKKAPTPQQAPSPTPTSVPVASQPTPVPVVPDSGTDYVLEDGSVVLGVVPGSVTLNYNGDVDKHDGTVVSKECYLMGNQIVYSLVLEMNFGVVKQEVTYFGGYTAYSRVKVGDVLEVTYQTPYDGYISVSSVAFK